MASQTTNPNSSEYSPEQRQARTELTPEQLAAQGELHDAWNDTLYGGIGTAESDDTTIAIEELGQRVEQQQVSYGIDGAKYLSEPEKQFEINEAGLEMDTRTVQQGASAELAALGMDGAEYMVTHRDAMNETVAEVVAEGQGEDSGRLSNEDLRDARNVTVATKFDKALRQGDTEAIERLPVSVAVRVKAWLGDIGQRYGGAEFAPNDQLTQIGEYITFAEKVAEESNKETVAHVDAGGEVVVESIDDIVMRVLEGDPEAIALLEPDTYESIKDQYADFMAQYGNMFAMKLEPEDQDLLIKRIKRSLLSSNAERFASAA